MLLGVVVAADLAATARTTLVPRRLAIFYGIPSLVNGAGGDVEKATAVFGEYDIVVFGDGLEFADVVSARSPAGAGPVEHARTAAIIMGLATTGRNPMVFGYVDLGRSQQLADTEIARRIRLWRDMGARGIFFDEAGYDFGVTRQRQNTAVDAAHAAGMPVILNAFRPDDVFLPSNGIPHRLKSGDAYLLESFVVRNGVMEQGAGWSAKAARAVEYAGRAGVAVHATTTTERRTPPGSRMVAYAWWAAALHGIDAFSWGEPAFGGPDSSLPWHERPEPLASAIGGRYEDDVALVDGVFSRRTDKGRIDLDSRRHAGTFTPGR